MGSRLQFWINHLRRIDAEGISIASYARREQLSVHSLYSARHQLRKSQSVKKPATRKQAPASSAAQLLATLLTVKYADGLPLNRFATVLKRHGVDIPRQSLARAVIKTAQALQPLHNLMRDVDSLMHSVRNQRVEQVALMRLCATSLDCIALSVISKP